MPVDRKTELLLEQFAAFFENGPMEATSMRARGAAAANGPDPDRALAASITDTTLPGPAGPIPVRIYRPREQDALSALPPCLVYFHGGGHVVGTLDGCDGLCAQLAHQAGIAVISVDYRLAPEHKFPAAAEDCHAATLAVAAAGHTLGIDPDRIAVGGDSAGGNLAAVVCLMAREATTPGPVIAHQLLLYPVTAGGRSSDSMTRNAEGYLLTADMVAWFGTQYERTLEDRRDWRLSPLLAASHAGLPPATIITAGYDPLLDDGADYADALRRDGVPVEYKEFADSIHGFIGFYHLLDDGRAALALAATALRRALG